MKILIVLSACILYLSVSAIEEDGDCNTLAVNSSITQPINGGNLNYCRVDDFQCCTNDYFEKRGQAIEKMIADDIQVEVEKQIDHLSDIVDAVENEIKSSFIPRFSRTFCGVVEESNCDKFIESPLNKLKSNLLIEENDDTDEEVKNTSEQFASTLMTEYINATVFGLLEYFVKPNAALNQADEVCIKDALQAQNVILEDILRNLTQIRLATSALSRVRNHVKSAVLTYIHSIRPAKSCIQSFINVRCDACVMNITGTCRGACNALVFGCLAPFAEGLRDEFNLLWNSTNQIVNVTNIALRQTGSLPQSLFAVNISNGQDLAEFLSNKCSLSLTDGSRKKRSEDNDGDHNGDGKEYELSASIAQNSSSLLNTGAFNSGNDDVPTICSAYKNTDCWNGSATVPVNNVEFDSMTISGQQENPLLVYNQTELNVISKSFDSVITEYLKSDNFQSVIPKGLVLENITTTESGNPNSATTIMAGYTVLLVVASCVLFIF